ncbi:MAG: EamA family transporter [Rickettsiales bacterium]|nr:EamA family transporter [Rickettsiales bacterium]
MQLKHKLMACGVAALWGGNFVAAKIALGSWPPFLLLGIRFVLVALILAPLLRQRPKNLPQVLLLSFVLGTLHFSLMFGAIWAGLDVSSGIIATQLGVPFSCLLGSILFAERIGRWRSLGMLVAFIGIVVIAGTPRIGDTFWQFGVSCAAAFAWATANAVMKRMGEVDIMQLLAWISLLCIPQYALLSWMFDEHQWTLVMQADWHVWLSLAYTAVFSTIVAYGMWYRLLGRFPVSHIAPYQMLVPVFGLAVAQWFFAEPLTLQFLAGGALTLAGVGLIIIRQPRMAMLTKS